MGLFGKKTDQRMADAQQQANDAMAAAQQQMGAAGMPSMGGADMAGMGGQDMAAMAAYSQKVNKIGQSGVEAPGVIHAIRATGTPDISGATMHEFDVTIRPDGGEMYEATVEQSMLPFQMEGIAEGQAVTVKYDPDNPTAAVLHSW